MLNKSYYQVLIILQKNKAINELQSMSLLQILEHAKLGEATLRKALYEFVSLDYVSEGYKIQKKKTYFITEKGIEFAQKIYEYKKSMPNKKKEIKLEEDVL